MGMKTNRARPTIHVNPKGGVWVDARELVRSPNAQKQIAKMMKALGHELPADLKANRA